MEYKFSEIEKKWQEYWKENKTYNVKVDKSKPKFYVLDMFPYPSGAGLHVGHPLGYIASDIYTRYKRLNGFNVLHPMGYDAYGLPAEQYAIQTGQHPAITTDNNIKRYKSQLNRIGFSYDWNREVRTCDPSYYKWTQWAFIQMFHHWYNIKTRKAEPVEELIQEFEENGNLHVKAGCSPIDDFTSENWNSYDEKQQQSVLLNYRIAYLANAMVNWCPELGTVLANDEVKDGVSVRGGHPVEQKVMKQWQLRVSAYAQRLLEGLDRIEWPESLKEMQRNWIGRSDGAEIIFNVLNTDLKIQVFTTRPDTLFGSTFMVLAPESELVNKITTDEYREDIDYYLEQTGKRSERDRLTDVKTVSGQFTGSFTIHPFTGKQMPIWLSDYVLAGYGTGAIMAVPAHDSRDYAFAKHYKIPIIEVVSGGDISEESYDAKEGKLINSDFLNGLSVSDAVEKMIQMLEEKELGTRKINYRLRDAIFSRQRYWGEPFPVYFKDETPYTIDVGELPLQLPGVDKYLPTQQGDPPLGRAKNWKTKKGYPYELSTMPGFAGSSAYYLRYMDAGNNNELVSSEANNYWQDVDLYIGGTEHATGHLIYSRFWNKFLFDLGYVCKEEPFKKLINQGMILGRSSFVYRVKDSNKYVSLKLKDGYEVTPIHVDVSFVENDILDLEAFKNWRPENNDAEFILDDDGKYYCGHAVEKMSKSLYNVVNPDSVIEKYGADTLRLYEMFLGPLEQSKPWDTKGIDGVHRFLKKLWRLFLNKNGEIELSDEKPAINEYKVLHKTIKKITGDIERYSFNTAVSAFMICVNELSDLKCNKREILEQLIILLSPFAPHISEELWHLSGNESTIVDAVFPEWDEKYLIEDMITYPVSFNGKMRFRLEVPADMDSKSIEEKALSAEEARKWLEGKAPKKVIVVPKRIINIVI